MNLDLESLARAMDAAHRGPLNAPRTALEEPMPERPLTYEQLKRAKQPAAKPLYEAKRGTTAERGYGGHWQRIRKRILQRDPVCTTPGCDQPSTEVDHLTPLAQGGTNADNNLQGLCKPCHSRKTSLHDGAFGR